VNERSGPIKPQVLEALCARVRDDLEAVRRSQQATQDGATHSEARAEHAKDTRATESSYLARGLAERVEALEAQLALLVGLSADAHPESAPISVGALITLEDDDGVEAHYLLAPAGGGVRLTLGDAVVQTITATSPLGRALVDRFEGDEIELERPRGRLTASVVRVA